MQIKCVLICRECRLVSLWCVVKVRPLLLSLGCFKKNLKAAKPPEQSKGLGGNIGCKVLKKNPNAPRPFAINWRL